MCGVVSTPGFRSAGHGDVAPVASVGVVAQEFILSGVVEEHDAEVLDVGRGGTDGHARTRALIRPVRCGAGGEGGGVDLPVSGSATVGGVGIEDEEALSVSGLVEDEFVGSTERGRVRAAILIPVAHGELGVFITGEIPGGGLVVQSGVCRVASTHTEDV